MGFLATRANLRETSFTRRGKNTDIDNRAHAAASLADVVLQNCQVIALFASMRGEINTSPLEARLIKRGCTIAYPRCEGDTVTFHQAFSPDLVLGTWNILEPSKDAPALTDKLDAIVVPGLAFDKAGNRLGYGKGFYDKTLHALPSPIRLGYCFDNQLVTEVPAAPHDEPMDVIVTEVSAYFPLRKRTHHG